MVDGALSYHERQRCFDYANRSGLIIPSKRRRVHAGHVRCACSRQPAPKVSRAPSFAGQPVKPLECVSVSARRHPRNRPAAFAKKEDRTARKNKNHPPIKRDLTTEHHTPRLSKSREPDRPRLHRQAKDFRDFLVCPPHPAKTARGGVHW